MITFMGVSLSKEEEVFLTSVIIEMADGQKISEEDILHKLIDMAQSHDKLEMTRRELRKLRKRNEEKADLDRLFLGKSQAYNKVLDLLD